MLKVKLQYFGHLMQRADLLEKTLMLGKIEGKRRGSRGCDGLMASQTQWTWVWPNSGRYWRTGKPGSAAVHGMAKSWHNWVTEQSNKHIFLILAAAAAAAKSLQSCLTLCDPIDSSPPGSPIPGILQARTLEWGAISFSNAWKWKVKVKLLSRVRLLATPWTAAHQAPPPMGFSRQEYWSGVPLPSPFLILSFSKR